MWAASIGAATLVTALVVLVTPSGHETAVRPSATRSAGGMAVPSELLNPDVTQATIHQTICAAGWTATVRPGAGYTTALKASQLAGTTLTDKTLSDYEEDHEIPLELGGAPRSPANLWPELWPDAHAKDVQENLLHREVCDGTLRLDIARMDMYMNWAPLVPFGNRKPR
jgi:hypothetical protein